MKISVLQTLACACLCHSGDGNPVGFTMEGGGWRAQTAYHGIVSGMLAYLGQEQGVPTTLASSGLLDRVDLFSSVSGGSWFFTSLAYSESYLSLVESMGASPETASAQMYKSWVKPLRRAMGADPARFNLKAQAAKKLADKTIGRGNADTLWMTTFFLATNATWNSFTANQLEAYASIGPDVLMGSDVMTFAEDKIWLCGHSVLLPTGDKFARLYQTRDGSQTVDYVVQASVADVPISVPAMFSITMGAGKESAAPRRYVADTSIPVSLELNFTGVDGSGTTFNSVSSALGSVDFSRGVLTQQAGLIPVAAAASASSAAAGVAPVLGLLADKALEVLGADFTPWFTNTANSQSLYQGTALVDGLMASDGITQDSVNALAAAQLHAVIDGGYTDNLGVGNALAAGADEVLVLSDCGTNDSDTGTMEDLFQGAEYPRAPGTFSSPVFEEPAEYVRNAYSSFHRLSISNTTFLRSVVVGTFTATTVDNVIYGVLGGRSITIHVVQVCGAITIGIFQNIDNYGTFAGEIVQTLSSDQNAAFMQSTLLPMFMGSAKDAVQFV